MMERERYVRYKRRRLEDQPTPLAGKIILFLAGFVFAGMIGLLVTCGV
jgi:hypothetical protein